MAYINATTLDTIRIEVVGCARAVTMGAHRIIELYDEAKQAEAHKHQAQTAQAEVQRLRLALQHLLAECGPVSICGATGKRVRVADFIRTVLAGE